MPLLKTIFLAQGSNNIKYRKRSHGRWLLLVKQSGRCCTLSQLQWPMVVLITNLLVAMVG